MWNQFSSGLTGCYRKLSHKTILKWRPRKLCSRNDLAFEWWSWQSRGKQEKRKVRKTHTLPNLLVGLGEGQLLGKLERWVMMPDLRFVLCTHTGRVPNLGRPRCHLTWVTPTQPSTPTRDATAALTRLSLSYKPPPRPCPTRPSISLWALAPLNDPIVTLVCHIHSTLQIK